MAILKKLTHSVSGSGYQCSQQKVTITTHSNLFFEKSEKSRIEPMTLSPNECWYMVRTQRCKDKQMSCDGTSCSYTSNLQLTFK